MIRNPLAVACPTCGAKILRPCREGLITLGPPMVHDARVEALAKINQELEKLGHTRELAKLGPKTP